MMLSASYLTGASYSGGAMVQDWQSTSAESVATAHLAEYAVLATHDAKTTWALRRAFARSLEDAPASYVSDVAWALFRQAHDHYHAWILFSLHKPVFRFLDIGKIEALGPGISSWETVDGFARLVAGPAWLAGLISDDDIARWARSDNFWWRRAALVSTVALNMRSQGGMGDVPRTLSICGMLTDDHEDMVVKAMSWALRSLVVHDPAAVRAFLAKYDDLLAARVKREVRNKLQTGLKNPRRNTV